MWSRWRSSWPDAIGWGRIVSLCRSFAHPSNLADSRLATLGAINCRSGEIAELAVSFVEVSEAKVRLREVRRELEGVIRGLFREAVTMENELARFKERAERWQERRKGTEKQLALGF